jgi:hypothetical protein
MAYNRRNLLNKILEIQEIARREFLRGIPYTHIFRTLIKDQYHISYSTFNNYLSCNAKREIALLDEKEAAEKRQLKLNF